ncbi:hypothetical protein HPG69_016388 [Diceros bicornis minor]|uniref:Uncharacterized protein n=1 Tax=Diceros bicornis minor TaxID=77932 RepID=A0A7J7EFG9_DICBM|nr:hypothetical protein HPG69_016388 [Diceros bicornis minor]
MKDCAYMFQIPYKGIPIYESMHKTVLEMIQQKGLPLVCKENPITRGSHQAIPISLARDLAKSGSDCSLLLHDQILSFLRPTESPITIEISAGGLHYLIVPTGYKLGSVPVTISGAVSAPYFKLGEWGIQIQVGSQNRGKSGGGE